MSDKIRTSETETSGGSAASDLYNKVMSHEGRVWDNVLTLNASPIEYAEAGAEAIAAVAVGKLASRAIFEAGNTASEARGAFETFASPGPQASSNKVAETFGRLSFFEKRELPTAGAINSSDLLASHAGSKVLDMAAYRNQFAGKLQTEVAASATALSSGTAHSEGQVIALPVMNTRPGGAFLPPTLGNIVPKDYLAATSPAAPSLDNLNGELKF